MMTPFYDPQKSFEENYKDGPFGAFADGIRFETIGEPTSTFLNHKVFYPFGIAAGPLPTSTYIKAAFDKAFDIVTYKTVRTRLYPCHPWPNILPVETHGDLSLRDAQEGLVVKDEMTPTAITNSFGVPSYDPDVWQPDMRDAVASASQGQVVIGAFQGTLAEGDSSQHYIDDFILAARLVKETGVSIMEVNLSCPNEGTDQLLCFDVQRVTRIIEGIKQVIGNTPLIMKIAYVEDDNVLQTLLRRVGGSIDAIEAINTIQAKIITKDGSQALPGKGRDRSGVGGPAIKWAAMDMVKRIQAHREEMGHRYTIIGCGGVRTKEDVDEYLHAGASAAMGASTVIWNPMMAIELKKAAGITVNQK